MGWADKHIEKLKSGETVKFRPHGNSMVGKISSGQLCTVEPVAADYQLKHGDIVLCKVRGSQYLHVVWAAAEDIFQIGNARRKMNGWTPRSQIYGRCIKVED